MDASASSSPSVKSPPLDGHPEITSRITELFVPHQLVFGKKFVVAFDGAAQGSQWWYDAATQTLYVEQPDPATATATGTVYKMIFGLTPPNSTKWPLRSHWEDFAMYYLSILAVVLAIIAYLAL
ncbi:hypothetical protein FRC19_005825 [Serendipita sp. 401]|nr:hypothetical protein FRC19_005825 [Serendipita sp. 401]